MDESIMFDLAGIGIGPFNLGLAALCCTTSLKTIFFERAAEFNWHPGLMLDDSKLQVPFYADLVTPVDPCSKFSFMAYLYATRRMFRFAMMEDVFIKRTEYNNYCRWVIKQIPGLCFNTCCESISFDEGRQCFRISTSKGTYTAKHIVIGVGTAPYLPVFAEKQRGELLLHSSDYLFSKNKLLQQKNISIIGSGQSAAEIFHDLMQCYSGQVTWFTRAGSFFPMDYSKFALEKASLDYIDYFFSLPPDMKKSVLAGQNNLYKGINQELITDIYRLMNDPIYNIPELYPCCELKGLRHNYELDFYHTQLRQRFTRIADSVILATGYKTVVPAFLKPILDLINWTDNGQYQLYRNYSVDDRQLVFIQNADSHSHGFNSADLSMGPYRNATILNTILKFDRFAMERGTAFQSFGLPLSQKEFVSPNKKTDG